MQEKFETFYKTQHANNRTDAYFGSSFQIFYDEYDKVEFIELSGYKSLDYIIVYNNINIFETKADTIISKISKQTSYDKHDHEIPYGYIFPELELGFWRPLIPDDMTQNSIEYNDSLYFQTVGIGVIGYYSNQKIVE